LTLFLAATETYYPCILLCVGLQPVPVYYEMTETALKVLAAVTSHSIFYSAAKSGNYCTVYLQLILGSI